MTHLPHAVMPNSEAVWRYRDGDGDLEGHRVGMDALTSHVSGVLDQTK